ncbi:FtsK/SpoIIIE domain-containing protein [Actinomadura mexicana]|uniref:DNA segregation ATPase FtsK/SpoIIIE, S-DNA-T family n=1 Tax=Actinomadura mexicana TaxID=134959 RepID=A0A239HQ73_9ACTN|nr:FtsK/SpoIIIE domain-containing protein [Actinomadura mexicana]SNS83228.1 DNA segregation ATPase FtsK/SpoIIIE, S-DNA-T family [Actinomadura mexicana]
MSFTKAMGEVVRLPVQHADHTADPAPALDTPPTAPSGIGAGVPPTDPPRPMPFGDPDPDPGDGDGDDGEAIEGRVLVDSPDTYRPDARARRLAGESAKRRPIIAPWLRDRGEAEATIRWAVGYAGHITSYHAARIPLYSLRLALRSPRGLYRVAAGTWRWTYDIESRPLRTHAIDRNKDEMFLKLMSERNDRVRSRLFVTGAGLAGTGLAAAAVSAAGGLTQTVVLAALVAVLGWIGTPKDKRILDTAVTANKAPKLTSEVVVRALASLGIAEINRAIGKGGEGIAFPSPITRDGPGWRSDIDLPHGVTADAIMEKRKELASGLRRPIGCVWPEAGEEEEHAGRLVLWVGDRPMAKAKQPAWPLAKAGKVDLFAPAPFGTDQRGRFMDVTLMFVSVIIGAIPRMGKTFILRLLALIAALDVRAELHLYDLKGTGDLSALEPVAHAYRAGDDDEDITYALTDMRGLRKEMRRRTKVIRELPKDRCPENKVTTELASDKSLGLHPIVIAVDECQVWFEHKKHGAEFEEICTDLAKRGPATGIVLILATQRPDKAAIPTPISGVAGMRICLKVMDHTANDLILGTSAHKTGLKATMFSLNDKGICYLRGEGDAARIVRSMYIDAPAAETIALRARAMRAATGYLTGYAAGVDLDTADTTDDGATLLTDIASVTTDAEDKIWSHVIVDRLAELRPAMYGPWAARPVDATDAEHKSAKATTLAAALKPHGIRTVQVNRTAPNGERENSRGIVRAHILDALDNAANPSR